MIQSNARRVADDLTKAKGDGKTGLDALSEVGRSLLSMVTSERAIALNRAAAGDVTGELGRALAHEGRNRMLPILTQLLHDAYGGDQDVSGHLDCYISLLLGDLQIRRAIGTADPLSDAEIASRAALAIQRLQLIYPPSTAANCV